ncbi:hypothetical protein S40293_10319, partial [Stachybotrys chartarum IBT 40293]
ANLLI